MLWEIGGHALAIGLCALLLVWALRLWDANLHVSWFYHGDAILHPLYTKGVMENGWSLHNPSVGAPFGMDMQDFPFYDNLNLSCCKLLGVWVGDACAAVNQYFLLTFPLTTVTTLFVLRHFRLSYGTSLVISLLYAFAPFHVIRAIWLGHLFLGCYYLVPLLVMVMIWLYRADQVSLWNGKTLGGVLIGLLVSTGGIYYAFFGCFLLLIAGLAGAVSSRRWYPLAASVLLIVTVFGGSVANLYPTIAYRHVHGPNPLVASRSAAESEMLSLRIVQLLMPMSSHRVTKLVTLNESYYQLGIPGLLHHDSMSLGLVASFGFLFLIARVLVRKAATDSPNTADALAGLNLAALLLATSGGFGFIFNFLVTPSMRGYDRISIYIAFFSVFAVALLLEQLRQAWVVPRRARIAFSGLLLVVLVGGFLDQTSKKLVLPYSPFEAEFRSDADYVAAIEATVPPGAMIYQMPYVSFPEAAPTCALHSYGHFDLYLHSQTLRWSHGSMRGREADQWHLNVVALPLPERIRTLAQAGFSGISVNRLGFADRGREVEIQLAGILGVSPTISHDQQLAFFSMAKYIEQLPQR
jgi:phosphoglycerol transferase